ncbi:unnamed protein product [Lathyrus oleraceus]
MKKNNITCIESSHQQQPSFSSTKTTTAEPDFHLPDDCWEHVFTFLDGGDFNSLSLVSKHFLSITNRLLLSITVFSPPPSLLSRIFQRFSSLNSLDLWFDPCNLDAGIALALRDRATLKSLSIFMIKLNDAKYLDIDVTAMYIDSFMSLKGLNCLNLCNSKISDDLLYSIAREPLPLKRFVIKHCTGYTYNGIYSLLSNCQSIQHLGFQDDDFLDNDHVDALSLLLPDLVSINLSHCRNLTESALFALIRNCHSLREITMEGKYNTRRENVEKYDALKGFHMNPLLKFLHLANNSFIYNESLILFASIFPNLELLDLSFCKRISEQGICQILSRCHRIRHLNLESCIGVRRLKMNFAVHQLEVLNLSGTRVDDKTLYEISKSCCGLLQLLLRCCPLVTKKGVVCVVVRCTQLKKIDLADCDNVHADDVVSMISLRSSLKIKKR